MTRMLSYDEAKAMIDNAKDLAKRFKPAEGTVAYGTRVRYRGLDYVVVDADADSTAAVAGSRPVLLGGSNGLNLVRMVAEWSDLKPGGVR